MSRLKAVPISEISEVIRGWETPVFFEGECVPPWLLGPPDHLRYGFIASGELQAPRAFRSRRFGDTDRVGGIYVLRLAPDGPKPFDREDWALLPSRQFSERLWLEGPYRHPREHRADHDDVRRLLDVCVL